MEKIAIDRAREICDEFKPVEGKISWAALRDRIQRAVEDGFFNGQLEGVSGAQQNYVNGLLNIIDQLYAQREALKRVKDLTEARRSTSALSPSYTKLCIDLDAALAAYDEAERKNFK